MIESNPTLDDWLAYIGEVHPVGWDPGLDRVGVVAARLNLLHPGRQVVLIAGTNGKGSTCAYLAGFAQAAGLKTGKSTSPHLHHFNERIEINGVPVDDTRITDAFAAIEAAREETTLTYFEFAALASLYVFRQEDVDISILEVGLGGRLDAMNIVTPDLTIITSISLDHQSWLGDSRETIGYEKAGIMREGVPCIIADRNPPASLIEQGKSIGAELLHIGGDFPDEAGRALLLPEDNYVAARCAGSLLGFEPSAATEARVAANTSLPGRCTRLDGTRGGGTCEILLDVAHNPAAAAYFAGYVQQQSVRGVIHALVGIYRDKDIRGVIDPFRALVNTWHLVDMDESRAASAAEIADLLVDGVHGRVATYANIALAVEAVGAGAGGKDLIIVFGSFPVVAGALQHFDQA